MYDDDDFSDTDESKREVSDTNLISVESKNVISEVVPLDSLKDDHKNFEESNILEFLHLGD